MAALGVAKVLEPQIEARLRKIEQQPQLLRFLIVLLRRLKWFLLSRTVMGQCRHYQER